ncbi:ABC transporter permease [Ignatzschineria rhizosphaerae]|uniref:ABC transporter permease n=1 Tax=Ignatzschineria rhizosphaerae TaxID=2923279 RepID=A0ABY3X5J3_9GAMM|nr:ABC transporter permease [Ignatzschineria rhizosphaerae]UNM95268.1 ABC transporter permease [Ignatzschineria rhizosphaerae]
MITLDKNTIYIDGDWTLSNLKAIQIAADKFKAQSLNLKSITIDGSKLKNLDTIGCQELYIALEAIPKSTSVDFTNFEKKQIDLFQFIKTKIDDAGIQKTAPSNHCSLIGRVGLITVSALDEMQKFIEFIGEISVIAMKRAFTPWNIRWGAFWSNIQSAGVMALPIIGLLNFLIGAVIAYQAGNLLRMFGASIYIVDFSAVAVLRVLGPLLTAIIIAGRTGAAYAAQIGTMVVNEEVDALETIGINKYDQLVLPKMYALAISLPLLTLFADMMAILGSMVLAYFYLDISFGEYLSTIPNTITWRSLVVGLVQAPVFAIVITLVGCYQGFQVSGGADSVGQQTTKAVVQSIFLVIVIVALFSILMRNVGL